MSSSSPSSSSTDAFLGVSCSVTGKRWISRAGDDRIAMTLSQRLNLPEAVGRVMAARGVGLDNAERFLAPTLRDSLPDPSIFRDMDTLAERVASAVMQGEQIVIFGDYDVDGATSSALLKRYLHAVGARVGVYIPDRLKEGYGPNAAALMKLRHDGASLVVTVDCGTTAFEALEAAHGVGLDVIVVDHHEAEVTLPKAVAVVNPKRLDEENNEHKQLAAVGLTFLCAIAINRLLRTHGWFATRKEPDLLNLLDLVALGTICDVVPLTGLNRSFVHQGLKVMASRNNIGINALADVAGIDEPPGTYHAGFVFGPRVNAGGRVGESSLGSRLLSTDDVDKAKEIATRLDSYNRERQSLEANILDEAFAQVESEGDDLGAVAIAAGVGWHPGVVGIVASRLKDRFNRPACVLAFAGDGGSDMGTGSGRSVNGVDLGQTIIAARQAGHIIKGGGHAMAAGFSLTRDQLPDFRAFLNERIGAQIAAHGIEPTLYIDGAIKTQGASLDLLDSLIQVGPFGAGNPEPRFVIPDARLAFAEQVGSDHVRCRIEDASGGRLNAIAFRCLETPLGVTLLKGGGGSLHLAGKLRVNTWQGTSTPQLIIDDAAQVW